MLHTSGETLVADDDDPAFSSVASMTFLRPATAPPQSRISTVRRPWLYKLESLTLAVIEVAAPRRLRPPALEVVDGT